MRDGMVKRNMEQDMRPLNINSGTRYTVCKCGCWRKIVILKKVWKSCHLRLTFLRSREYSTGMTNTQTTQLFYKATRPNGTDFYTGTIDYAAALQTGASIWKPGRFKRFPNNPEFCTSDVLHASDAPAETLVGGQWPCRLFEVTGKPVAQEGHKFGFQRLKVERELPAWQALGPNGERVVAVIDRASRLTSDEIEALAATWDATATPSVARDDAWKASWGGTWYVARDAARDIAWDAARDAALSAAWTVARPLRPAARAAAGSVTRSAALAEIVADLISSQQYQLLAGPWLSVIGESCQTHEGRG
jgi:hypothetical protein